MLPKYRAREIYEVEKETKCPCCQRNITIVKKMVQHCINESSASGREDREFLELKGFEVIAKS